MTIFLFLLLLYCWQLANCHWHCWKEWLVFFFFFSSRESSLYCNVQLQKCFFCKVSFFSCSCILLIFSCSCILLCWYFLDICWYSVDICWYFPDICWPDRPPCLNESGRCGLRQLSTLTLQAKRGALQLMFWNSACVISPAVWTCLQKQCPRG